METEIPEYKNQALIAKCYLDLGYLKNLIKLQKVDVDRL